MTNEDKMTVTYTAKELFQQIQETLKEIAASLDKKATTEEVIKLEARLDLVEDSIRATDLVATALLREKKGRWSKNEKLFGVGFAVLTCALNIMALGPDVIH